MANPLLVNAAELLRRPGMEKTFVLQATLADLDVVDPERFATDAEVDVQLHLESLTDGIVVDGVLSVPWHGICRRCLVDTGGVMISEVHELYQLVVTDPEAFEIVADQLDLRALVREVVLLDVPSTPLCRPDCAGLCPSCGANLNDTTANDSTANDSTANDSTANDSTCGCTPAPVDPRWAALDALHDLGPAE